jgi:predicted AAA+ superfamily ATPase
LLHRNIESELERWAKNPQRKPLVLRGARQTGKTFAINSFAKANFQSFVYLNLEKVSDLSLFKDPTSAKDCIERIELRTGISIVPGQTLLFIDEIQQSPVAMQQLRFFYEEVPDLHVIAAGSLLEVFLSEKHFEIPVGRVEYRYLYPCRFDEFLGAVAPKSLYQKYSEIDLSLTPDDFLHAELTNYLRKYVAIGGMPEAVAVFQSKQSTGDVFPVHSSLIQGFKDDVYKYSSSAMVKYLEHVLAHAPKYVGKAITYERFAGSDFRSREISGAFKTLELARLLKLAFPTFSVVLPVEANYRRSPKLLFLDVGLCVSAFKATELVLNESTLSDLFRGQIAEQYVGQALMAQTSVEETDINYWLRDKRGASAEVDFVIGLKGVVVPIEVKSGSHGKMRSLHQFIEQSKASLGVRVYNGKLLLEEVKTTQGTPYKLLSVPFYLMDRLPAILLSCL